MLRRTLFTNIRSYFFKGKAILITGARQVGKTTLLKQLMDEWQPEDVSFLNCDEPDISQQLENVTSTQLKNLIGNRRIVFIDEAQRIDNIGITLKLIIDNIKDIQLIVTGSSTFDIRNKITEPLTGRKFEFQLFPFSTEEMINASSLQEEKRLLEQRLIYGMYPDVVNNPTEAEILLVELCNSYLFKDILAYKDIRRPDVLNKLLIALALQLGNEVSYNELGKTIGLDKETVERYLDLLEKVYVIFRLHSFSRNLRKELKKSQKVYFYDNGIRNALINNFQPLALRNDVGALWENFMVSERKKYLVYKGLHTHTYFWRTHAQQEIDYIEERDGYLYAFEFKWKENKKVKLPVSFAEAYPQHQYQCINPVNYLEFVI
jgi:predicted AAA+ superfamily ATPase